MMQIISENNQKENCWEFKKCGREKGGFNPEKPGICPVLLTKEHHGTNHGINAGRCCWKVYGTSCDDSAQKIGSLKITHCLDCDFFKKVKEEEGYDFNFLR